MRDTIAADKGYSSSRAKAIVAGDGLRVEWSRGGRGPGVPVVVHHLVAQRVDREGVIRCAHIGSNSIAIHFAYRRRESRVVAVRIVVPRARESGRGHHWRIHV